MSESEGRKIHGEAAIAREKGRSEEALKLAVDAMVVYQREGDMQGFSEIFAEMFLSARHLFERTGERGFLFFAKNLAQTSVDIARESGQKENLVVPLFNLAKAEESLGFFNEAVKSYKEALDNLENNPSKTHHRAAILADFKVHLATCEYRLGDKEALEKVERALSELEDVPVVEEEGREEGKELDFNEEVSYNKNVWISGGYMRLAEVLKDDDKDKALEYLKKAKEVIDSDSRLTLRANQWEKLSKEIG